MFPKGKAQDFFAGSVGKGRPESSLIVEEPAWPLLGGAVEATCKCPVTSRRERPFRGLVPYERGTVLRVTAGPRQLGSSEGRTPVGLSGAVIPASGPRGQPCQPGACGGCLGLGGPPSLSPLSCSDATPLLLCGRALDVGRSHLPRETWSRCPGVGLTAAGASVGLDWLKTPWEGKIFPSGFWLQRCCVPRGPHSCVAV